MPLDDVDPRDSDLVALGIHRDDLANETAIFAADHFDAVALTDVQSGFGLSHGFYSTSGASEMMRMKRFSRSSRPTGPKMRVPRGSPSAFKITAAFSSNLMYEPSARRRSLAVRTTTALTISPFLTLPPGIASLTVATMMSPMPA